MKKLFLTLLTASTLVFTGCLQDDDTPLIIETTSITNNYGGDGSDSDEDPTITMSGSIVADETWTADNIYILDGAVAVEDGVTLTIEPGTIIKGLAGTGSLSSYLVVARGGTLNAIGEARNPIIFTSISDNISIGETSGSNLDETDSGLWGGLIVLGYATCSFGGDVTEEQIEGIPADEAYGLYGPGGADIASWTPIDDDNSGTLQYISIRHGGTLIGEGNEINGLTLGGVGSGTTIDNIEVVANVDDGVEFFGGTVNASNLLVWAQGDDALDIDQAYSGTITNAVVVLGANSDHGLEIDGPEGTTDGSFTLNDVTLVGNGDVGSEYADYRSNAMGASNNVFAYGFDDSSDVELDNDGVATNYNDGELTFSAWEIILPETVTDVTDVFVNKAGSVTVTGFGSEATAVDEADEAGADTTVLSWSYTFEKGSL